MKRNYILEWSTGELVIWRLIGVEPSIRIFEDGRVAESQMDMPQLIRPTGELLIVHFDSYESAVNYTKTKLSEWVWYHHYTLPQGYNDKGTQKATHKQDFR